MRYVACTCVRIWTRQWFAETFSNDILSWCIQTSQPKKTKNAQYDNYNCPLDYDDWGLNALRSVKWTLSGCCISSLLYLFIPTSHRPSDPRPYGNWTVTDIKAASSAYVLLHVIYLHCNIWPRNAYETDLMLCGCCKYPDLSPLVKWCRMVGESSHHTLVNLVAFETFGKTCGQDAD